jgi:hypothetical protein
MVHDRQGKMRRSSFFPDRMKTLPVWSVPSLGYSAWQQTWSHADFQTGLLQKDVVKLGEEFALNAELFKQTNFSGQSAVYSTEFWKKLFPEAPKLNPKQQSEFVAATEQNVPSADPKVMQAVSISRQLAADFQSKGNQAGILIDDSTGLPIGDPTTYFPHMLNEAGAEALRNKPNTFFKDMATANNMDEASFRNVWDRFISPNKEQVAGFERQRQFQIPDQNLEVL